MRVWHCDVLLMIYFIELRLNFFFHLKYWRVVNIAFDFICGIQYFRVSTLIRREMIDVVLFFNIRYFFLKRTAYNRQHFMFYTFIMADLYNMESMKEFYSPLQSVLVYNILLSSQVHSSIVVVSFTRLPFIEFWLVTITTNYHKISRVGPNSTFEHDTRYTWYGSCLPPT